MFSLFDQVTFAKKHQQEPCALAFHGHIIDGETNKGIEGAVLLISSENKSCISGHKGLFEFDKICNPSITIVCEHLGYKSLKMKIEISHQMDLTIKLHADTCTLESVVVIAYKKPSTAMQESTLKGQELDKTRGLSLGESIVKLPGVFAVQTGPSIFKPVVQGMYGQRLLILNNGVRQEGQQWGSEHAPEIDPFVASKITVIKGAQTVRYGSDAIGGVVLVEPQDVKKGSGITGDVNIVAASNNRLGVLSSIINYSPLKLPNLSIKLQGTLRQAGNARTPNYWLDNTGLTERNFSWATAYTGSKIGGELYYSQFNTQIGIFTGSHFGDTSDLAAAIRRQTPDVPSVFTYQIGRPYQQVNHELFKAKTYWQLSNYFRLEADYARQFNYRAEFDTDRPYNNSLRNLPEMKFGLTTHTTNWILHYQQHPHFKTTLGFLGMKQANTVRSTLGSFFIPNYFINAAGLYLIGNYHKNAWGAELGIRYDYRNMGAFLFRPISLGSFDYVLTNPSHTFQHFSYSLAGSWNASSIIKFKANFATAFRAPTGNELYSNGVHHGVNAFEKGDSALKKEIAYNSNFAIVYNKKKSLIELSIYHNYINNYIFLQPMTGQYIVSIRGATPLFEYRQVNAAFLGLDALIHDSLNNKLVWDFKLSLLRATNLSNNEGLILTPPARINNSITFCNFLSSKYNFKPYLTLHHSLVTRKTYVPDNSDFKAPPKGFDLWALDLGVEKSFGKYKINCAVSATNLLNKVYRDYMDRFRYFNDAIGRNIMLRLKFTFI